MINDKLFNAGNYSYDPRLKMAFDFLGKSDTLPCGRYDIAEGIYANVMEFNTMQKQDLKIEAHKNYIDVQYIASGNETMGFYSGKHYEIVEPYDADRDVYFVDCRLQFLSLKKGEFIVFFPSDFHMPSVGNGEKVKKVVVKIKV